MRLRLLCALVLLTSCKDPRPQAGASGHGSGSGSGAGSGSLVVASDAGVAMAAVDAADSPPSVGAAGVTLAGTATQPPYGTCTGTLCKGSYTTEADGTIHAVVGGPPGTIVEVQHATYKPGDTIAFDVIRPSLGLSMANFVVGTSGYADIPVNVTTSDGRHLTESIRLDVNDAVQHLFEGITKGPVRFPVEGEAKFPADTLVTLPVVTRRGPEDARLWDVDFIAVETTSEHEGSVCHYVDEAGKRVDKPRTISDVSVVVYDRRTGKRVAAKAFRGTAGPCEAVIEASRTLAGGYGEAEEKWLDGLLKPRPDGEAEIEFPAGGYPAAEAPAALVTTGTLPSFEQVTTRFWSTGLVPDPGLAVTDNPNDGGMHSLYLHGVAKDDPNRTRSLVLINLAGAAASDAHPYFQLTPTSLLLVAASAEDDSRFVSKQLYDQLVGKSPDEMSTLLKADGWDATPEDPLEPTLNDRTWFVTRGAVTAWIHLLEWGAVVSGKDPEHAIVVTKDGILFSDAAMVKLVTAP